MKESRVLFKIRTDGERVIVSEPGGERLAEVRLFDTATDVTGMLQAAIHEAVDEALDVIDDAGASLAFEVGQRVCHLHWPTVPFYVHGVEVRRNVVSNRWGWFAQINNEHGQMTAWVPVHFLTPLGEADKCPTCGSLVRPLRGGVLMGEAGHYPCNDEWHDRAS